MEKLNEKSGDEQTEKLNGKLCVREVKRKKRVDVKAKSAMDLVRIIEEMDSTEYLKLDFQDSELFLAEPRWMKKGKTLNLRHPKTGIECARTKAHPWELLYDALKRDENPLSRGYGWMCPADRTHKTNLWVGNVEGIRLYEESLKGLRQEIKMWCGGRYHAFSVDSRSRNLQHDAGLYYIPIRNSGMQYVDWIMMRGHSTSEQKLFEALHGKTKNPQNKDYVNPEVVFSPQEIAGFWHRVNTTSYVRKGIEEELEPVLISPFIVPSQRALRFYDLLENNVLRTLSEENPKISSNLRRCDKNKLYGLFHKFAGLEEASVLEDDPRDALNTVLGNVVIDRTETELYSNPELKVTIVQRRGRGEDCDYKNCGMLVRNENLVRCKGKEVAILGPGHAQKFIRKLESGYGIEELVGKGKISF